VRPETSRFRRPSPSPDSIALIELRSIAQGYAAADRLVKAAQVQLLRVEPVSPGKLVILFSGPVAELDIAHREGVLFAGDELIDSLFLPRVHPDVLRVLETPGGRAVDALGILECSTVAAGLLAADAAAKSSDASLIEIHAAAGIGGKTTILLTGTTADAEAALDAGAALAEKRGGLLRRVLIASAHPDLAAYLDGRWGNGPGE
jgi:microcompartment protein CcmL/EutN